MSASVYPCIETREMHLTFQELSVPGSVQNDLCFSLILLSFLGFFYKQHLVYMHAKRYIYNKGIYNFNNKDYHASFLIPTSLWPLFAE